MVSYGHERKQRVFTGRVPCRVISFGGSYNMPRSSKVLKFLCHSDISMYKNFSIHCKICLRAFKVPKITRFLALSGNSGVVAGIQRDEDLAFHLLVVSFSRELFIFGRSEQQIRMRGGCYSRLPATRTLYNSNLPLTQSNFHFPSDHFLYNFTLDNSNIFLFSLKVQIIGSRLYFRIN